MAPNPDFRQYDYILVNTSAGKDSQAMMDVIVKEARLLDVMSKLVAVHCDLGEEEWPGTKELAAEHAAHYGLRFEVVKREGRSLLQEIEKRGKWPDSQTRYCTSYYKRDQALKLMTALARTITKWGRSARILNCYGFRAQESTRRKKLPQFQVNKRASNSMKLVEDWLPIQDWTVEQVWDRIKQAGTRHHPAYNIGMPRLSCRFCIFAPKDALIISARANPELFAKYVAVEQKIGHTFRKALSLVDVQKAVESGVQVGKITDDWNM